METLQIFIPVWNITELNGRIFRLLTNSGLQPLKTLTDVSNQNGKTTANIGQSCALYSIIRFGNGMRLIDRRPFYMISFGVKLTK